jgi:hypothetical protein
MMNAIQQAPECLRPLLLILSASQLPPSELASSDEEMEAKEAGTEKSSAPGNFIFFWALFLFPKIQIQQPKIRL